MKIRRKEPNSSQQLLLQPFLRPSASIHCIRFRCNSFSIYRINEYFF